MTACFSVRPVSLDDPQLRELLALHLAGMRSHSPPGSVHALDVSGLDVPDVTLWGARAGDGRLAAMGALKRLARDHAEVKSMRTHPDYLRMGAAAAVLQAIIAAAQAEGVARLSLETGTGEAFEPALALYHKRGFAHGAPFGPYAASDFNRFLHLDLG